MTEPTFATDIFRIHEYLRSSSCIVYWRVSMQIPCIAESVSLQRMESASACVDQIVLRLFEHGVHAVGLHVAIVPSPFFLGRVFHPRPILFPLYVYYTGTRGLMCRLQPSCVVAIAYAT